MALAYILLQMKTATLAMWYIKMSKYIQRRQRHARLSRYRWPISMEHTFVTNYCKAINDHTPIHKLYVCAIVSASLFAIQLFLAFAAFYLDLFG